MKFFIKLILVFAVLIGAFLYYVSTKPDSYNIKYTKQINAPVSLVYQTVNNFKTWGDWAPWMEQDTTLIITLNKKFKGVDSGYTWKSEKDTGGSMKTVSLTENKNILQKLNFNDGGSSDVYWEFKSVNEGTEVTWGIKGNLNLLEKAAFTVAGGPELMFKPMIIDGLNNLDNYIKN